MAFLKNLYRKKKYGEPIVVVSGLLRAGTSMMMSMLEAGGIEIEFMQVYTTEQLKEYEDFKGI